MAKRTQQQIVLMALAAGGWMKSFHFVRERTAHGWLGTSGDRRARELVKKGQAERRHHNGHAEFRITEDGRQRLAKMFEAQARRVLTAKPIAQPPETLFRE